MSHRFVEVDGLQIFFRETGPKDAPTLLLLHGFPSASHQFRRLIDALGSHYRLIAPDYPGFGYSDAPQPASSGGPFAYTFDHLGDIIERFCDQLAIHRFVAYMFDYGAPIGFRLITRRPDWIAGLVVQNGNAYEEGLSSMARELIAGRPETPGFAKGWRESLTLAATRGQYVHGAIDPDAIAPDGWTLDQYFLDLPGRKQIQVDLGLDYHSNVALYPQWQAWLRRHRPPTLILWGRNDPFFLEAGAHAYLRDVPNAELHLVDAGHFALEERIGEFAPIIADFLDRTWKPPVAAGPLIGQAAEKEQS